MDRVRVAIILMCLYYNINQARPTAIPTDALYRTSIILYAADLPMVPVAIV